MRGSKHALGYTLGSSRYLWFFEVFEFVTAFSLTTSERVTRLKSAATHFAEGFEGLPDKYKRYFTRYFVKCYPDSKAYLNMTNLWLFRRIFEILSTSKEVGEFCETKDALKLLDKIPSFQLGSLVFLESSSHSFFKNKLGLIVHPGGVKNKVEEALAWHAFKDTKIFGVRKTSRKIKRSECHRFLVPFFIRFNHETDFVSYEIAEKLIRYYCKTGVKKSLARTLLK